MLAGEDLWWSVTRIPIWSRNIAGRANKGSSSKAEMFSARVFNYVCSFTSHNKAGFCVTGETTAQNRVQQPRSWQGRSSELGTVRHHGYTGGLHLTGGLQLCPAPLCSSSLLSWWLESAEGAAPHWCPIGGMMGWRFRMSPSSLILWDMAGRSKITAGVILAKIF